MTRDFDLIRKLLVFFDEKSGPELVEVPDVGAEYSASTIQYHLRLLYEAGFLNCEPEKSSTSDRVIRVHPFDLTWEGHEFLAKIKSSSAWEQVKAFIMSKGGTLSVTLINQVAPKVA